MKLSEVIVLLMLAGCGPQHSRHVPPENVDAAVRMAERVRPFAICDSDAWGVAVNTYDACKPDCAACKNAAATTPSGAGGAP